MNHTPIKQHNLLTCPACAWRGVITTDGRVIQTAPGEPGCDHIGQAIRLRNAQRRAEELAEAERQMLDTYTSILILRLVGLYQNSMPLPYADMETHARPSPPMTAEQLTQYGRWIRAEHDL